MGRILTRSTRIAQPGALVGIADDFLRYKPRVVVDFARSRAILANTAAPLGIGGTRVATPYGMGVHSFSGATSTPVGELCHPPQTQIALVYISATPAGTNDVAGFSASGDYVKFTVSPYQWTWLLQRNYVGPQIVVSGSGMPCQPAAGKAYILVSRSVSDTDHAFRVIRLDNGASEVGTATTNTSAVSFVDSMSFNAGVGGYTVPLLWAMFDEYIPDAVLDTITANPWAMLAPARRPLYFDAGGGPAAVLEGSASGAASASGSLTTGIPISGAALSVASASGTLAVGIPLAGAAASMSTASGSLTAQITLAGSALAQAVSSALLSSGITMTAAAVAQAAADGTLTTAIQLLGGAQAQAGGSGSLTTSTGGLEGNAQASASASASLSTQIRLSGAAIASAGASGSLGGSANLAGTAVSAASASGELTVNIALTAQALASAIAQGSLTAQILLDADAAAQAQAGAALSGGAGFVLPAARSRTVISTARRPAALSTSRR